MVEAVIEAVAAVILAVRRREWRKLSKSCLCYEVR